MGERVKEKGCWVQGVGCRAGIEYSVGVEAKKDGNGERGIKKADRVTSNQ
jgi:hypothetical protein